MSQECYRHLASVYDRLMQEVPYGRWLAWAETMWRQLGKEPKTVIDLACGTGTLTWLLAESGRNVIGVDRSNEMLSVALAKADQMPDLTHQVQWVEQDMRNLSTLHPVDAVVCFCDSMNYLLTEEDWQATFHAVWRALRPGGVFLFDIHSVYKITTVFGNERFVWEDKGVYCIWKNWLDETKDQVEEELTLFVAQEDGRYERFDETHVQRTFPVPKVKGWLERKGFSVTLVSSDFQTHREIRETDERVFFCAQKIEM